jgi:hypothetical protein
MSMSVGAVAGGLSRLHAKQHPDPAAAAGAAGGAGASDPLAALLDSLTGTDQPLRQAGAALDSAVKSAETSFSRFSSDTMNSLLSVQSQNGVGSTNSTSTDNSAETGVASAEGSAEQFAQWIESQAQTLLPAAGALLALV